MFVGSAWRVVAQPGEAKTAVELQEMRWTSPSTGHVLIKVSGAGAGLPDRMMAEGNYPLVGEPPFGLGQEAAGEVVAVSVGSQFSVGDHVTGITAFQQGWGGYAEYVYLLENSTIRVPRIMSEDQAAGFPIAFRTAHAGLVERGQVEEGETVLVLGAAGSSGCAVVKLAKALGATVIAVAGGKVKTEFCLQQGADHVVDHRTQDVRAEVASITGGRGVDVIYDPVGGDLATGVLPTLTRGGRILLAGQASGAGPTFDPVQLMMANLTVMGVIALPQDHPDVEAAIWSRLAGLAATGAIGTAVGATYDFEDVPKMLAEQVSAGPGKIVVRVR